MKTKSLLTSLLLIIGLSSYTFLNSSYSLGFGSYSNTTCPTCHGGSAPTTSIAINGLPTFYTLGQAYPISVTITNTSKLIAGFQIRSNIGTITSSDPAISIYADNKSAGHNIPQGMTAGVATFDVVWTAPTSGSVAANFGAQGIGADGTGNTNNDSGVFTTVSNIALPVIFSNLKAYLEDDKVAILFTTTKEESIDQLEIQKSRNGIDFETLETLEPKGEGIYKSFDYDIIQNNSYYYRIKETSLENTFSYSEVVSVNYQSTPTLSIYPTIVKNNLLFVKGIQDEKDFKFNLYSIAGQSVKSLNKTNGVIDLNGIPAGVYIATLHNEEGLRLTENIFIQ